MHPYPSQNSLFLYILSSRYIYIYIYINLFQQKHFFSFILELCYPKTTYLKPKHCASINIDHVSRGLCETENRNLQERKSKWVKTKNHIPSLISTHYIYIYIYIMKALSIETVVLDGTTNIGLLKIFESRPPTAFFKIYLMLCTDSS